MPLLLNIDTATEQASVCIGQDATILSILFNDDAKQHGAFLQPAIQQLIKETGIDFKELDAIAVTGGPGSYTGLRVGLASAKGLCYALNKPLIMVNTLEVMAKAVIDDNNAKDILYCPMIDARRMEVFTAVYDKHLKMVLEPQALVLSENSFSGDFESKTVIFSGNGAEKWQNLSKNSSFQFSDKKFNTGHLHQLARQLFIENQFANLAYAEPFYLKAFYSPSHKS
jgi:tRNA threonylcarbamoyladenosine biosynthesis protein TsaB